MVGVETHAAANRLQASTGLAFPWEAILIDLLSQWCLKGKTQQEVAALAEEKDLWFALRVRVSIRHQCRRANVTPTRHELQLSEASITQDLLRATESEFAAVMAEVTGGQP